MLALTLTAILAQPKTPTSVYDFTVTSIDGKQVKLSKYKGKVLLIVNTASKCGLTPQYEALQALYERNQKAGFEILGFPCNDFRGQEPGTEAEIKEFCSTNYHVSFPLFSKVKVLGEDAAPLYKYLISKSDRPNEPIEWNFAKFLIDRNGMVVSRFSPKVTPADEALGNQLSALLHPKSSG